LPVRDPALCNYVPLPVNNKNMTLMSRQLAPIPQGLPLEIYAFSSDKRWENYEYIMADIFDHLLAAVPFFGLEVFELPSILKSPEEKPDIDEVAGGA
jgi:miniconductance mechanosensitive channel